MNKFITVPKDSAAMIALDYNEASNEQLYELVLSEEKFKMLWDSGVFQEINYLANVNIDFAEDESITELNLLSKIFESNFLNRDYLNEEVNVLISHLRELVLKAIHCKTGIFFYF